MRKQGFEGPSDAGFPTQIEIEALSTRGCREDFLRVRLMLMKLDSRVHELESELVGTRSELESTRSDLKENAGDLVASCDEVDCSLAENTELRMALQTAEQTAESSNANSNYRVVIDSNSNSICSSERGLAQKKDDCGSGNSSARSGDDKKERGGGEQRPTSIIASHSSPSSEKKGHGRNKKAAQTAKAREMVNGGKPLTRGEIATPEKGKGACILVCHAWWLGEGGSRRYAEPPSRNLDANGIGSFKAGGHAPAIPLLAD